MSSQESALCPPHAVLTAPGNSIGFSSHTVLKNSSTDSGCSKEASKSSSHFFVAITSGSGVEAEVEVVEDPHIHKQPHPGLG